MRGLGLLIKWARVYSCMVQVTPDPTRLQIG